MSRRAGGPYRGLQRWRRTAQIGGLLLPLAIPALLLAERPIVIGSYYALSFGPLDFADPLQALQTLLLSRTFAVSLALALVLPVLLALVLGRVFCGWVCPYNTLLEAWAALEKRIAPGLARRRRRRAGPPSNPKRRVFWGTFAGLVALVPLTGFPVLSYLSPPGILSSQVTQALLGMGIGLELAIVGLLFVVEAAWGRRYWCRQLCPVGAALGAFSNPASLRIVHDAEACACHARIDPCRRSCPIDLAPKLDRLYPSCIHCGLCLKSCEGTGHGALRFEAPRPFRKSSPRD